MQSEGELQINPAVNMLCVFLSASICCLLAAVKREYLLEGKPGGTTAVRFLLDSSDHESINKDKCLFFTQMKINR